MKRLAPVLISVAVTSLFVTGPASAAQATSMSALRSTLNSAAPGDRIVLADGDYTTGGPVTITRSGTADAPITIIAANVGRARIGGSAGFVFADGVHHVVLRGFDFYQGGSLTVPPTARANRITRNTFQSDADGNWVTVSADDTEVDHNTFRDHRKAGVFLQVTGPGSDIAKRTWIHHNHFYNHTFGGSNGGESILLGYRNAGQCSALEIGGEGPRREGCQGPNSVLDLGGCAARCTDAQYSTHPDTWLSRPLATPGAVSRSAHIAGSTPSIRVR